MPEEVSAESKLYVKEEIEKTRKEIKEEVEKVSSKATKTFTTVAIVVGLLTGLGVYGSAQHYINSAVKANLGTDTLEEIQNNRDKAENSYKQIVEYESKAEKILSGRPIIGTIVPYGGEIVETTPGYPYQVQLGWFFCNGASLDRVEYKDLFDIIGVAFGAPDSNTFNLPDLRGRFIRGVDHTAGNDPDARLRTAGNKGGNIGDKVGSMQDDALKSHLHQLEKPIYKHHRSFQGDNATDHPLKHAQGNVWITKTNFTGGSETRPKNIYVNWIIRAQ